MDLNKLYKLQEELDKHILEKNKVKISKEELLGNTMLALLVEVGELANTTRCFKHWSKKGMMEKEIVIEELADVWHFYLSIGNQMQLGLDPLENYEYEGEQDLIELFVAIYRKITVLQVEEVKGWNYNLLGDYILLLGYILGFTDEEVEQAYLEKHEENYKRQEEGY